MVAMIGLRYRNARIFYHIKGVTQGVFSFNGSMNYTKNGVEVLEEMVPPPFDTKMKTLTILLVFKSLQ